MAVSPGPAWHQFLASMECPDCRPAQGRAWTKADADGQPVILAAEPCAKHLRMFDQQGWVPSVSSTPVL